MPELLNRITVLAAGLMATAACVASHAQVADPAPEASPYVEVTVQINGLESSAVAIRDTMGAMRQTLERVADERGNLSPEELAALGELIDKSNALTVSLERTIGSIPQMVQDVREPSRAALTDWLSTTSVQAVDPAIRLASREVKSWLRWVFAMALALLVLTAVGLYLSARELRQMARVLKSLADDYEIVPRQRKAH